MGLNYTSPCLYNRLPAVGQVRQKKLSGKMYTNIMCTHQRTTEFCLQFYFKFLYRVWKKIKITACRDVQFLSHCRSWAPSKKFFFCTFSPSVANSLESMDGSLVKAIRAGSWVAFTSSGRGRPRHQDTWSTSWPLRQLIIEADKDRLGPQ